jgi:hypothetical protein
MPAAMEAIREVHQESKGKSLMFHDTEIPMQSEGTVELSLVSHQVVTT